MPDEIVPIKLVIFRRWRNTNSLIAIFPELPADYQGHYCDAYERIGQHGGADYFGVMQATTPVSIADANELAIELTRIGYNLKQIKRASWKMHQTRRKTARNLK